MKYFVDVHIKKCPKCNGIMKQVYEKDIYFKCNSCKAVYKTVAEGQSTRELEIEEVEKNGLS